MKKTLALRIGIIILAVLLLLGVVATVFYSVFI